MQIYTVVSTTLRLPVHTNSYQNLGRSLMWAHNINNVGKSRFRAELNGNKIQF